MTFLFVFSYTLLFSNQFSKTDLKAVITEEVVNQNDYSIAQFNQDIQNDSFKIQVQGKNPKLGIKYFDFAWNDVILFICGVYLLISEVMQVSA